eukprot:3730281-Pyramimonas_sp.AAC.1
MAPPAEATGCSERCDLSRSHQRRTCPESSLAISSRQFTLAATDPLEVNSSASHSKAKCIK